jgi:hypothetical protein
VPGSRREPRLWLEPIDRATEEFVDKTAHVVGRENESTFLVVIPSKDREFDPV